MKCTHYGKVPVVDLDSPAHDSRILIEGLSPEAIAQDDSECPVCSGEFVLAWPECAAESCHARGGLRGSQGDHRMHLHSPPRRNITRHERYHSQKQRNRDERRRILRLDPVKQVRQKARQP